MVRTCRRNRLTSITEIRRGRYRVDMPKPIILPMTRNFSEIAALVSDPQSIATAGLAPWLERLAHRNPHRAT